MPNNQSLVSEIGGTGTQLFDGFLSGVDYNAKLTGWTRIDEYDKMRKGDATVRASWLAVILPVLSADWYIKPASDSTKDKEIAEFVKKQFFEGQKSWTTVLREVLLYLAYGSYVGEKVYEFTKDGKVGFKKLFAPRLPKTIVKWEMSDGRPGITQTLPTGGAPEIPAWKLLTFVNEQEGDNYEGISIFRTAWKHWWYKEGYYRIDSLAQERQGVGIPTFTKPAGATPDQIQKMKEIMRNLRANEEAYIEKPAGWEVDILQTNGKGIKDAEPMIAHHDRQISKNVLAQFIELGASNGSGSRATSENHSELFMLAEYAVGKYIQEVFQRDAVKELVDLNFTVEEYPKLAFGNIGMVDFQAISAAINSLSGSKLITPNYETELHMRKSMHLPEITEDEYEEAHAAVDELGQYELDPKTGQPLIDPKTGQPVPKKNTATGGKNANKEEVDDDLENDNDSQKGRNNPPKKGDDDFISDIIKFRKSIDHAIAAKEHQS
jgi:phage gp29-like protein